MSHCFPVCKPGHWASHLPEEAYLLQCVCFTAQEVQMILFMISISYHSVILVKTTIIHNTCLKLCVNSDKLLAWK